MGLWHWSTLSSAIGVQSDAVEGVELEHWLGVALRGSWRRVLRVGRKRTAAISARPARSYFRHRFAQRKVADDPAHVPGNAGGSVAVPFLEPVMDLYFES